MSKMKMGLTFHINGVRFICW